MHKPLIGIYGRTNSGKSSLLNFLTGQEVSIVSEEAGTTTDSVRRSYEIRGFGPVVFMDTAGLDDLSALGEQRMERTISSIDNVDLAILVTGHSFGDVERRLIEFFDQGAVPYIVVNNIFDGVLPVSIPLSVVEAGSVLSTDLTDSSSRDVILEAVKVAIAGNVVDEPSFFGGRISHGDVVIMVCPIDSQAPAGRLILPQVQAVRAALDENAISIVVQLAELQAALAFCAKPRLIVTDSQLFQQITPLVPPGVELTSFSILLSELKGDPETYKKGLEAVDRLTSGARILMVENCSHQTSCEDIGRVKIPRWVSQHSGFDNLTFDFVTGRDPLPADLSVYSLVVQCGGCMVSRRMIQSKIRRVIAAGVPITNYGLLIRRIKAH